MTGITNASGEMTLTLREYLDWASKRLKVVLSDGNEYESGPLTVAELEEKKNWQHSKVLYTAVCMTLLENNNYACDKGG